MTLVQRKQRNPNPITYNVGGEDFGRVSGVELTIIVYKVLRKYVVNYVELNERSRDKDFPAILRDYWIYKINTLDENSKKKRSKPFYEQKERVANRIDFNFIAEKWCENLDLNNYEVLKAAKKELEKRIGY